MGFKYDKWIGTEYQTPRTVTVKVRQTIGAKPEATFTIQQNHYRVHEFSATYYQWGRKDPFPIKDPVDDSWSLKYMNFTIGECIQNPNIFVINTNTAFEESVPYANFWSMERTASSIAETVSFVKTIYDPTPAGFRVTSSDVLRNLANKISDNDQGLLFNCGKDLDPIFFPETFFRCPETRAVNRSNSALWSCNTETPRNGIAFRFTASEKEAKRVDLAYGLGIRPQVDQ